MGRTGLIVGLATLVFGLIAAISISVAGVEASRFQPAAASTELAERNSIKQSVRALFEASDYRALERLAGYYRSSGARTPSGIWKLTVLYGAFHDLSAGIGRDDNRGWQRLSTKIAEWQSQVPGQPTPPIVQAIALKSYAWALRPRTIVVEASTGSEQRFLAALTNTRVLLEADKAVTAADPHYYVLRADVGTALGEPPDALVALIGEGRSKFPSYFALDMSGLDYFAVGSGDKSIGPDEARRIEAFAATAAADVSADGDERYARLYWHAYAAFYGNDLFTRSMVSWPRMRNGMTEIVTHYPDAWNINNFAYLACLAGDRATTRNLMQRLPDRPLLTAVWQAPPMFAHCRSFANAPIEARR